jgi:hypothetical protein
VPPTVPLIRFVSSTLLASPIKRRATLNISSGAYGEDRIPPNPGEQFLPESR